MPNALDITLHTSAAETASGSSAAVDLGDRTMLVLTVDVTAISGSGATLTLSVQTSATQSAWELARAIAAVTATGTQTFYVPVSKRWARVTWTLTGTSPSATFAVAGQAHQLYALPADVTTFGLPQAALQGVSPEQLALACLSASDEAAGYLGMAFQLPLTQWDTATRKHVAYLAAADLLAARGYSPGSGMDKLISERRAAAIQWLSRIADGKLRPVGMVDASPSVRETDVYVVSQSSRGWGS